MIKVQFVAFYTNLDRKTPITYMLFFTPSYSPDHLPGYTLSIPYLKSF